MEIRQIAPGEYRALADLTVDAYRALGVPLSDYEPHLRDVAGRAQGATVLVAVEGGRVVGGVTYVPGPASPEAEFDDLDAAGIRMLAVAPEEQRRGIGRALVLACLDRARGQGRARVVLHSTQHMAAAHRLYRGLGFSRRPEEDWQPAPDVYLAAYVLELAPARASVRAHRDPQAFLDATADLLLAREGQHTLLVSTLTRLAGSPMPERGDALLLTVEQGGALVGAAVRAPPRALLLSSGITAPALDALVAHLAAHAPDLPRVHGTAADAGAFAARWARHAGGAARPLMNQRLFTCEQVVPPRGVPGVLRDAGAGDRALLAGWVQEFTAEAVPHEPVRLPAAELVDRLVASQQGGLAVWEVGGRAVSMASHVTAEVASRVAPVRVSPRIGLVYTPPEARGRGYASACVAALTQRLLGGGHARTLLFADLANPTSNRIYRAIGYRAAGDFVELALRAD